MRRRARRTNPHSAPAKRRPPCPCAIIDSRNACAFPGSVMANSDQQHHDLTKDFLGKELYVIVTTPVVSREELDKMLPEHLAHQIKLEKQGIMFGAGPLAG